MSTEPTPPPAPTTPEVPKSFFEKINMALPVALTALATVFAGMSNGQLQEAMFWRSYAAQDQAKAANQWTLAGFKRDRALICQSTAVQMAAMKPGLNPFASAKGDPTALAWLQGHGPTAPTLPEIKDEAIKQLLAGLQARRPEAELLREARKIPLLTMSAILDESEQASDHISKEWDVTLHAASTLVAAVPADDKTRAQQAWFEMEQRRYGHEARLNQALSLRYEVRVKITSAQSERHQHRSRYFFYAMLAAQVGATIASLALARQQRSLLWAIAGLTGLAAMAFGGYVFLLD